MLQRHQEREKALSFLREWFWKSCSQKLQTNEAGPLEQHVFTVAAICAELIKGAAKEREELVALHEGLERFAGGEVNRANAEQALLDHPDVGFSTFLLGSDDHSLSEPLNKVLSTETVRKMLADALRCQKEGRDLDEASLVFSSRIGKEFLSVLKRSKVQQYKEMFRGSRCVPSVIWSIPFRLNRISNTTG